MFAGSPQAKERVERVEATFKDRLMSELRLVNASNLEEASRILSEYLPRYNERSAIPAAQAGSAYLCLPSELELKARGQLDGEIAVLYEGGVIPIQEASPRGSELRESCDPRR